MVYNEDKEKMVAKKNRKRETLKLYLWQAPRTPIERQQNKEVIELAKRIRFERSQQLLENMEGYRLKQHRDMNFIDYFTAYIDKYNKKDKSIMRLALKRFIGFFNDTPYCNQGSNQEKGFPDRQRVFLRLTLGCRCYQCLSYKYYPI